MRTTPLDQSATAAVLALFDAAERAAGHELVDEAERLRVQALHAGEPPAEGWRALVGWVDGEVVGYAGAVRADGHAVGELVVAPAHRRRGHGRALLHALEAEVHHLGVGRLVVWSREDAAAAALARSAGYRVARRLVVMARPLSDPPAVPPPPEGTVLRTMRPGADDAAVAAVLADAFAGHPDPPWTVARVVERRHRPWFDPEGVLLATTTDGRVVGVHWTKDRGGGVGEVHLLAVHRDAAGQGLGRLLLRAGLQHLARRGCREVVLWAEADNHAAIALYRSEGFAPRWTMVAYGRDL